MATCKACTHYDVCGNRKEILSSGIRVLDSIDVENICPYFRDRSRFTDLPKIGNYVYRLYPLGCTGNYGISKMKVKGICISTNRAVFDMELIEKIVFFTREEAEQALKELKQRNNTD